MSRNVIQVGSCVRAFNRSFYIYYYNDEVRYMEHIDGTKSDIVSKSMKIEEHSKSNERRRYEAEIRTITISDG